MDLDSYLISSDDIAYTDNNPSWGDIPTSVDYIVDYTGTITGIVFSIHIFALSPFYSYNYPFSLIPYPYRYSFLVYPYINYGYYSPYYFYAFNSPYFSYYNRWEQEIGMETIIIMVSMRNTMILIKVSYNKGRAHPMLSYIRMEELV